MAIHVIQDSGSFQFFAREPVDEAGNQQTRVVQIIGWAIDDVTLEAKPVVFPALEVGETLVFKSFTSGLREVV